MITLEKIMQKRNMLHARVELMRLLTELSDDALEYVWRPIAYAYYWTDGHDMNILSEDDIKRFHLIVAAAYESSETVRVMDIFRLGLSGAERKEQRRK